MAEEVDPKAKSEEIENQEAAPQDELDLDEDLADAIADIDEGLREASAGDIDAALAEADPDFAAELDSIAQSDFSGVVIDTDQASTEIDENAKVPSFLRARFDNLPKELKSRYMAALLIPLVTFPFAIAIYMGKILPSFSLPYHFSMKEVSEKIYTYSTDEPKVPLFDQFRSDAYTHSMSKILVNLRTESGDAAYAEFEFFLSLREEKISKLVEDKNSEIQDILRTILARLTWEELQTPLGKEKVKKTVRHQLNSFLQGNYVLGVYYRSVILKR